MREQTGRPSETGRSRKTYGARHRRESGPRAGPGIRLRSETLAALLILAMLAALYVGRSLLLPIVLAFHLSLVLAPVVGSLKRWRIPAAAGAGLILLALLLASAASFYALSGPATTWIGQLPDSFRALERKVRSVRKPVEVVQRAAAEVEQMTAPAPGVPHPPVVRIQQESLLDLFLSGTHTLLAGVALTFLTLYFLLASWDLYLRKIVRLMPRWGDKKRAVEIVRETQEEISNYLFAITFINAALAVVLTVVFWAAGLPNPVLWGAMAFLLNYIPYLGPFTGIVVLTVVSAASFTGLWHTALVPGAYFVLHNLETNVLTPMLLGQRLTLSPLAIFLWLSLWFWMWGMLGALLAVPMLKTLKIICDHTRRLAPLGELIGR